MEDSARALEQAPNHEHLLTEEARLSKRLFKLAAQATRYGEFVRAKRGSGGDPANRFLDHGNYLAYGLAATATWVLGIPMDWRCYTARPGAEAWCSMWRT